MKRKIATLGLAAAAAAVALAAVAGLGVWPAGRCPSLGEAERARLISFIRLDYKLPAAAQVAVADDGTVFGSCFHRLIFAGDGGRRPFRAVMFASPDFRLLTDKVLNAVPDLREQARQRQEFAAELLRGKLPSKGPESAPATLVVFSDFQCPFCAKMAKTLSELTASEGERVRVVYHYFPLAVHRWAEPAAEAGACAQEQSNAAFWSLHDFLFAHQGELNADNLRQHLGAWLEATSALDREAFETCLSEGRTSGQVEQDRMFGEESGVHATPTLFLNGEQIEGNTPDELRTAIRRIAGDRGTNLPGRSGR